MRLFSDYFWIISGLFEIICRLFIGLFVGYLRLFADYFWVIEIICGLFVGLFVGYLRLFADYLSDYLRVFRLSPELICHD